MTTEKQMLAEIEGKGWTVGVVQRPDGKWQWVAWPGPAGQQHQAYVDACRRGPQQVEESRLDAVRAAVDDVEWQLLMTDEETPS